MKKDLGFWPPLDPDPTCTRCGGTGYSRVLGPDVDTTGRCVCNTRNLDLPPVSDDWGIKIEESLAKKEYPPRGSA